MSEGDALKPATMKNHEAVMEALWIEVQDLNLFKDRFFYNHPTATAKDKSDAIQMKREELGAKLEVIDEACIPTEGRAEFLYLKGRCYNALSVYDHKALECLSEALELDHSLVNAWNELGECSWKNRYFEVAKACFEAALEQKRDRVTLRSLSVLLRDEKSTNPSEAKDAVLRSVELAKEAVGLDPTDGQSWTVLGNAYLAQYFLVAHDPATIKLALSSLKQASQHPMARGHPDIHFVNYYCSPTYRKK